MRKQSKNLLRPLILTLSIFSVALSGVLLPPMDSGRADNANSAYIFSQLKLELVNWEDTFTAQTSYKGFVNTGMFGSNKMGDTITWTSEWYACDSKTTFRATDADDLNAVAGSEVANEAAVDGELTGAGCVMLTNTGGFNLSVSSQSDPEPKYSFVEFDAANKQFISLKVTAAVAGETTIYAVSTGFDRPEVATAPELAISGSTITSTAATFTGDFSNQANVLHACDTAMTQASDQSNLTTNTALTANNCTAIQDENGNIPATIEEAGVSNWVPGVGFVFETMDIKGKHLSLVSSLDNTVYEVTAGVLVPATPTPAPPYVGPVPVSLNQSCVPAGGGTATLTGMRLETVNSASVGGVELEVVSASSTSVDLKMPAMEPGVHAVVYTSAFGKLTHLGGLRVCADNSSEKDEVAVSEEETQNSDERFFVKQRFAGYAGDSPVVVATDLDRISAFVVANPGIEKVTCQGSTSGVPAIRTDEALATNRAKNACAIVESLIPGVETKILTVTGAGVGQFHRAVIIYGVGSR